MPDRQDLGRIWLQSCFVWLARVFAQNRNLMTLNKAGFLPFSRSPSVFLSSLHTTGSNHTLMLFLWIWAYDLQHSTSTFLKGVKTPPQARVAVPGRRTGPAILIIHSRSSFRAWTLFIISPMWTTPKSVYSSFPLNFSSIQLSPVLNLGCPKVHYWMSKIPLWNLPLRPCFLFQLKVQHCFTVSSLRAKLPPVTPAQETQPWSYRSYIFVLFCVCFTPYLEIN